MKLKKQIKTQEGGWLMISDMGHSTYRNFWLNYFLLQEQQMDHLRSLVEEVSNVTVKGQLGVPMVFIVFSRDSWEL